MISGQKFCLVSWFVALGWSEGKAPKIGEQIVGFLLHGNARAHRSVLVKDFLAKNNVTTLEHLPPYSPYLPPTDFYVVPRRK